MNIYYLKKFRKEARKEWRVRYSNKVYQVQKRMPIKVGGYIWGIEYKADFEYIAIELLKRERRKMVLKEVDKERVKRLEDEVNKRFLNL